jgi:hypothetical protein
MQTGQTPNFWATPLVAFSYVEMVI